MPLAQSLLALAAVVALAQAERKGVLQAMLSRPLVVGTLLGVLLGDARSGLMLGAVLELLWLGGINIGANLPDNEVVGTGAVVGAALIATGGEPVPAEIATLSIVLLAPLAALGRRLDVLTERKNVAIIHRAGKRLAVGGRSGRVNLLGLLAPMLLASALATTGALLGGLTLPIIVDHLPSGARGGLAFAFPMLVASAAALGLASVRAERAKLWAAASAGLALVLVFAYQAIGGGP